MMSDVLVFVPPTRYTSSDGTIIRVEPASICHVQWRGKRGMRREGGGGRGKGWRRETQGERERQSVRGKGLGNMVEASCDFSHRPAN